MRKIRYCRLCIQSNTRPGITLNADGVCSACEGHHEKIQSINWIERELQLRKLFDEYRGANGNNYDCIVPVSGGKDSTYQVYVVKIIYGMNPLCVTYRTPLRTPLGQKNLDNLQSQFDVDLHELSVSPDTERRFILKATKELGVPGLPQHLGIFSFTLRTAVELGIPLIVWGENSQMEYGGTLEERQNFLLNRSWLKKHGCLHEREAKDWVGQDLSLKQLRAFELPSDEAFEKSKIHSFFLGQYLKWDPHENARIAIENGFSVRPEGPVMGLYNFADLDCYIIAFHHYVKWLKYGMTRTFDNVAIEIRNGRMTKEQGLEAIKSNKDDLPPKEHLEKLSEFLGINTEQLLLLIEPFRNTSIWKKDANNQWMIEGYLDL